MKLKLNSEITRNPEVSGWVVSLSLHAGLLVILLLWQLQPGQALAQSWQTVKLSTANFAQPANTGGQKQAQQSASPTPPPGRVDLPAGQPQPNTVAAARMELPGVGEQPPGYNQGRSLGGEGFVLSGEVAGASRRVLKKVLPEYPAGAYEHVKVSLTFVVKPDGKVTGIKPVRSAGRFTLAAQKAMTEWRFNPVSSTADQSGMITFNFTTD